MRIELNVDDLLDIVRNQIEQLLLSDEISEEEKLARIQAAQEYLDKF